MNEDSIYQPSKYVRRISSNNTNSLLGQDSTENDVKEEEYSTKKELATNNRITMSCEIAKPQLQVVGLIES